MTSRIWARYAVYYAPEAGSALAALGNRWMGRDPESEAEIPRHAGLPSEIGAATEGPRRYGFHGTIKPPMVLAEGRDGAALDAALGDLAARLSPVELGALTLGTGLGFLALVPPAGVSDLDALAFEAVRALDGFRAPPSEAELAKRRAADLSPGQEEMLARWGYPYVGVEFRFHLTLTSRLDAEAGARLEPAAAAHFAPVLDQPFRVRELCLFGDPGGGGHFRLLRRHALTG